MCARGVAVAPLPTSETALEERVLEGVCERFFRFVCVSVSVCV